MSPTSERKKVTQKISTFSKCSDCGETFLLYRTWQRYCSRLCKYRAWAKIHRPRVVNDKP